MCGIAGIVRPPSPERTARLGQMAEALRHRGPDSGGFHERGRIALAVRRLRVIDLVTGDQPIKSACSGATIVYNGELYNYRDLRPPLERRGHRFTTASDTEVLLHHYEEFGVAGLADLNGMFAAAIDDPRSDSLVLFRDQIGVKPLYYATSGDGAFLFASEPKALLRTGLVDRSIDRSALAAYLQNGHSTDDRTIYASIRKLPAGHALTLRSRVPEIVRYWDLLARARRWSPADEPPVDEIAALLRDAVERNMIADVPVGAFLSGGVDSSLVTALMRPNASQLHTYSVGFGERDDELPAALRVAERLGTLHTDIRVTPDDAGRALDDLVAMYDEPFADAAAIPTYLMAKRAREDVTVVLTGEGGDEVFGGYRRYVAEQAHRAYAVIPRPLRALVARKELERARLRRFGRTLRALAEDDRIRRYALWTELFDAGERSALIGETGSDGRPTPHHASTDTVADDVTGMMVHELKTWLVDAYLEKVDKSTMATSLEARVPLLDPRIVEMLALAPRGWKVRRSRTKVLLREIAARSLPREIIERPKHGFNPPVAAWLNGRMSADVDSLTDPHAAMNRLVDPVAVRAIVDDFRRGAHREGQIWALVVLERWARAEG